MREKTLRPYGTWKSPFSPRQVAASGIGLSQIKVIDDAIYWVESRPRENGRSVVVQYTDEQGTADLTPAPFNARSRANEYGGGVYAVQSGVLYVSGFDDQRIYRFEQGLEPEAITPIPEVKAGLRYADTLPTDDGKWLICVRESHQGSSEPINELVAIASDGSGVTHVLSSGRDFYSSPKLNPRGDKLIWLAWDHPNMPWDGSELWRADLTPDTRLVNLGKVAGGEDESIFQPEWAGNNEVLFVSDRNGWWNLFRTVDDETLPILEMEAEFGTPQWVFGMSRYARMKNGEIACVLSQDGFDKLAILDAARSSLEILELDYSCYAPASIDFDHREGKILAIAGSAHFSHAVLRVDPQSSQVEILRHSLERTIDEGDLSLPEPISFPTGAGETAHALFYAPQNQKYSAPESEKPPLLILSHGGPTSKAHTCLQLSIQFWTSRGFAVTDVNYRGSSGYGREYRERLNGNWGVFDVEDCIAAAEYLAANGQVDGSRLAIRGGSAGGYTTLCALVFHTEMAAGASYYGVADLERLALDTHKFESRYLDRLIGPYPAEQDVYRSRSPVHFAERIRCPVILFQGSDDRVVPPSQAEKMLDAMRENEVPHAYILYEGEGHGFRKAENIQHALESELAFYGQVFGFQPADDIPDIELTRS